MEKKFMFKDVDGEIKVFYDQKPEVDMPIFEWRNRSDERNKIHNSKWRLENYVNRNDLIDPTGEVHSIEWGQYHDAVNFSSWKEYLIYKKIKDLESTVTNLRNIIEYNNNKINNIHDVIDNALKLMVKGHKEVGYNENYRNAYLALRSII